MQHFKFVNWRIRFLMSRTGYKSCKLQVIVTSCNHGGSKTAHDYAKFCGKPKFQRTCQFMHYTLWYLRHFQQPRWSGLCLECRQWCSGKFKLFLKFKDLKRFKAVKNILRYENSYVLNHSLGDQDSIWSSFINTIIYSFPLHGEKNTAFFRI